jgi:hypothetical protein
MLRSGTGSLRLGHDRPVFPERRMMLLLFGFKTVQKLLPGQAATCQYCGVFARQHLEERATRFTLFFIPVFTTSRSYRITCSNCGATSVVNGRQKRALVG